MAATIAEVPGSIEATTVVNDHEEFQTEVACFYLPSNCTQKHLTGFESMVVSYTT